MKKIEGYDNYFVDEFGNVFSVRRNGTLKMLKKLYRHTGKPEGYLYVKLYKNGKGKPQYIHRLVADAFIKNKHNVKQVNHRDENKQNNSVENLEWVTAQENIDYSWSKAVRCIETGVIYKSQSEAARQLSLHVSGINNVLKGRSKHTGGFTFEYV